MRDPSSRRMLLVLAVLLAVLAAQPILANDEDFGFELSGDFEVELDGPARKLWGNKEITAIVGRAFHLVIPRDTFGPEVQHFEAKRLGNKPLPLWLLFDKTGGVFWGVPLLENVGTVHIIVKSANIDKNISEEFVINVVESNSIPILFEKCSPNEDSTILTLLIDKGVRSIKPKQRIIAINNIAKFFGLPFGAFTLKSQTGKDDITDSSVVLAGPGNLKSHTPKSTTLLQVPVGCDGRLWLQTAQLVHQLKQQARDGTITEVIGLPLIGWRVRTETRPIFRTKRQIDDYGSGDYDDYYDENYDDEYEDEELSEVTPKVQSVPVTISSTNLPTETHPHRHHHGETKNTEDSDFNVPIRENHHQNSSTKRIEETSTSPVVKATSSASISTSTTPSSTTISVIPSTNISTSTTSTAIPTTSTTSTTTSTTTTEKSTTKSTTIADDIAVTTEKLLSKPNPAYDYEYEDYDDDEDNDEGSVESKTIIPILKNPKIAVDYANTTSSTIKSLDLTTTSTVATTTTLDDVVAETSSIVTTPTATEQSTTPYIVEDTDPPIITTTESTTITIPSTLPTTTTSTSTTTTTATSTVQSTTSTTTTTPTSTTTTTPTSIPPTTTSSILSTTLNTSPTTPTTQKMTTEELLTTFNTTTSRNILSTPRTTTVREITESIDYQHKNFQPYIKNRLKQMSVIAGKIFRFVIPLDTFKDFEDEYNLTLDFLNSNGEPISKNSWCHFNPLRREIYGLPLEDDVSKWEYVIRATDKEGASVSDRFTIQVQQHKSQRVVNHEFSLLIRIEKHQEFPHYVDWCLKTLRALGRIYNTNMSEITVRHVNYTSEPVVFTWTNDSIPTNYCPKTEIERLFKILTANDRGDPSRELNVALAPELRVKKVLHHGLSVCETPQIPVTPPTNFRPFLRNPVDHINATVGELLVFRVPDDTFYDPEDTDSRILNISLLTGDRQPIPANNWLQFDSKNREFYGIPKKAGRSEYQLVCVDSAGLPATDSLEIVVYPAPKTNYNVEFSMTVETSYETFSNSASLQKKFVEKLQQLFGDRNSSLIHMNPFKPKHESTIVTWYNKSLSISVCPHNEINRLESVLKSQDRGISSSVHSIMDPEFPVSTIKVLPTGNCKVKPPPPEDRMPIDESAAEAASDDYLITFIVPAVIISVMLFLAALAACVLYRRRRTGKMNVEEDGRQSYGNKGIPVIFQEELEEKPESGTKTPVILKDEKPPLAPPEYSKSGSLKLTDDSEPYQPPPPFTRNQDNGRQPRPKPTPTYRKPPPYVPP